MSDTERQKLQDLFESGFIHEEEYNRRLAEYGFTASSSTATPSVNQHDSYNTDIQSSYSYVIPSEAPTFDNQHYIYNQNPQSSSSLYTIPSGEPSIESPAQYGSHHETPQQSPIFSSPPTEPTTKCTSGISALLKSVWGTDSTSKSKELEVENTYTVINRGGTGSMNIIRSDAGVFEGVHEFRFRLDSKPEGDGAFAVGVCFRDIRTDSYVGGYSGSNGWGYLSNGMKLYSDVFMKYHTQTWKVGDIISVILDLNLHLVSFKLNNMDLGVAFKNVHGRTFYPCVTVPGPDKGKVSKSFGSISFLQ